MPLNYRIIKDRDLSVDTLINRDHILFTESEIRLFQKTPWTWHMASDNIPVKNNNFFWDAGYSSLTAISDIDTIIKNAMKQKPLHSLNSNEVNLDKKISELNRLSHFLGIPKMDMDSANIPQIAYKCKIRGLELASMCLEELFVESKPIKANATEENKIKFAELIASTSQFSPVIAFVKGSYVSYIEFGKKTKTPAEAYVQIIVKDFDEKKYYDMLNINATVEDIRVRPLLIPYRFKDAYTFFDLDVNKKSRFIHGNENVFIRRHPDKILRVMGNTHLEKIRSFTSSDERIENMLASDKDHKKIYLAIRQAYLYHWQLHANGLGEIAGEANHRYKEFNRNLPLRDLKRLLAESSIEVSELAQRLNRYIERR
jgi:hypothetical protein